MFLRNVCISHLILVSAFILGDLLLKSNEIFLRIGTIAGFCVKVLKYGGIFFKRP